MPLHRKLTFVYSGFILSVAALGLLGGCAKQLQQFEAYVNEVSPDMVSDVCQDYNYLYGIYLAASTVPTGQIPTSLQITLKAWSTSIGSAKASLDSGCPAYLAGNITPSDAIKQAVAVFIEMEIDALLPTTTTLPTN